MSNKVYTNTCPVCHGEGKVGFSNLTCKKCQGKGILEMTVHDMYVAAYPNYYKQLRRLPQDHYDKSRL